MITVGFDLDMTLVDSRHGITVTMQACLAEAGIRVSAEQVWPTMGLPLRDIVAHLAPDGDVDALAARYRVLYPELGVAPTTLLPGAAESVAEVHRLGGRVVVVSAKLEPGVTAVLRHVGLDQGLLAVDAVSGGLFGPDKSRVLAEEGADLFVGDHPGDVAAARGAGAVPVGVTTGAHDGQQLLAAGAHVVLSGLGDLPELLRRWARPGSATRVGCACGSECDAENR